MQMPLGRNVNNQLEVAMIGNVSELLIIKLSSSYHQVIISVENYCRKLLPWFLSQLYRSIENASESEVPFSSD